MAIPPSIGGGQGHDHKGRYFIPAGRCALGRLMRLRIEAAHEIERLLSFMDDTDGDFDLEMNGDELDANYAGSHTAGLATDESEHETSDLEPILGWPEVA